MLGMLEGLQQPRDELTTRHADLLSPLDQALGRPLHVRPVRGRHVDVDGREAAAPIAATVRGHALAAQ